MIVPRCQRDGRKVGPGSLRVGIRQTGSHRSTPVLKCQTATKNGVYRTHGATHRRQAAPVPVRGRSAAQNQERTQGYVWETSGKNLTIKPEELWDLQHILNGKKAGYGKTYTNQTEVNDNGNLVREIREVSKNLGEIDLEFDKEFAGMRDALEGSREAQRCAEIAAQVVHDKREDYHQLSEDYEAA